MNWWSQPVKTSGGSEPQGDHTGRVRPISGAARRLSARAIRIPSRQVPLRDDIDDRPPSSTPQASTSPSSFPFVCGSTRNALIGIRGLCSPYESQCPTPSSSGSSGDKRGVTRTLSISPLGTLTGVTSSGSACGTSRLAATVPDVADTPSDSLPRPSPLSVVAATAKTLPSPNCTPPLRAAGGSGSRLIKPSVHVEFLDGTFFASVVHLAACLWHYDHERWSEVWMTSAQKTLRRILSSGTQEPVETGFPSSLEEVSAEGPAPLGTALKLALMVGSIMQSPDSARRAEAINSATRFRDALAETAVSNSELFVAVYATANFVSADQVLEHQSILPHNQPVVNIDGAFNTINNTYQDTSNKNDIATANTSNSISNIGTRQCIRLRYVDGNACAPLYELSAYLWQNEGEGWVAHTRERLRKIMEEMGAGRLATLRAPSEHVAGSRIATSLPSYAAVRYGTVEGQAPGPPTLMAPCRGGSLNVSNGSGSHAAQYHHLHQQQQQHPALQSVARALHSRTAPLASAILVALKLGPGDAAFGDAPRYAEALGRAMRLRDLSVAFAVSDDEILDGAYFGTESDVTAVLN